MRAIILAAGKGTRLLPLTRTIPKPLIKVTNTTTIIEHTITSLKLANITNIVINVSYLAKSIKNYLGDGLKLGVNIKYSEEKEGLETAGGIKNALHLLGNKPFIAINADIMHNYKLNNLKLPAKSLAHLVLIDNHKHNLAGDFSLSATQKITAITTKSYTFSGIGIYHPQFFKTYMPKIQKLKLITIFKKAIIDKCLSGEYFNGYWLDIGTFDNLQLVTKNYNIYSKIK